MFNFLKRLMEPTITNEPEVVTPVIETPVVEAIPVEVTPEITSEVTSTGIVDFNTVTSSEPILTPCGRYACEVSPDKCDVCKGVSVETTPETNG